MRRIPVTSVLKPFIFTVFALLLAGCSLQKQTAVNRGLQNLTAHYNILFNANEILRQKQASYALSYIDSYNQVLTVYQDTTTKGLTPDKDLEDAREKANKIIAIKEQSHYIGDAYMVLGKAGYLDGNYYDAIEYFSYVIRSFPKQTDLVQEACVWKARSMIYLGQLPQAKLVLDTAIKNIDPKKDITADVYATKLQYDINVQEYADAEEMAKQAIHYCGDKTQRLRWTFILAQLQELNNKNTEAYNNYTRIVKSNAPFEMAFNASLNRIRIENNEKGSRTSRIDDLRALLKNQNNKEFTDQVYFQIAELYYGNKDIDNAIKNYRLSVKYTRKNQTQKGLSYLRLADISFKNKADYVSAKKYYDSTLFNLAPNYPGYQTIQKTAGNLQLLADRYQIISQEDTLQMLAKLDEKTRDAHIDAMVNRQILQQQADAAVPAPGPLSDQSAPQGPNGGNFYFYNSNAVSQGYNDFKRVWGNRKLEDDWRRSNRSNSNLTDNTAQSADPDVAVAGTASQPKGSSNAANYRQQLVKNLPLTPQLLARSNTRIYNAYFDIANFYRDVLGDKKEAIGIYELLLNRFPDIADKAAIYYTLYRLYSDIDASRSELYKNMLLKNYADTPYAKVITDPDFSKREDDANAEFNAFYNQVYDLYAKKKYDTVIMRSDQLLKQYPNNPFSAQLLYLRAIAAGHNEKLPPFQADLQQIVSKYPHDQLIAPLVQQHLTYINANLQEMAARPVVLVDNGDDIGFIPEPVGPAPSFVQQNAYKTAVRKQPPAAAKPKPAPVKKTEVKPPLNAAAKIDTIKPQVVVQPPPRPDTTGRAKQQLTLNQPQTLPQANAGDVDAQPVVAKKREPSIFNMSDSTNYYFVVNVSSGTTNLASSRFGIGQFNRANLNNNVIKHHLLPVGDDTQLIYVGRFYSLNDAKEYAKAIIPLLPEIMKVPKDKYMFFIITQGNLNKITSKKLLADYIDYYQENY